MTILHKTVEESVNDLYRDLVLVLRLFTLLVTAEKKQQTS